MNSNKVNNFLKYLFGNIAFILAIIIMAMIVIFGLAFSADYSYLDYPIFSKYTFDRLIYLCISLILINAYMLFGKLCKWSMFINYLLFIIISFIFIFSIPLKPFSDMKNIYDIAVNRLLDDQGYLSNYSNQIPVTIYLWIITSVFGKNIIVPKIFNIIWNVVILYYIYKIYSIFNNREDINNQREIIWFSSPFISIILYENHIYNDVLFTALTIVLVYIVLNNKYNIINYVALCMLSVVQYLIRPTGIIYIIATFMYMIFYQQYYKKALIYILICLSLILGVGKINEKVFDVDESTQYPVWSFIQMGINEEEFGFQDGSHSADWTMDDCIEKYKSLGIKKLLKIYVKKELWMWSEGTYQAERYGFGDSNANFVYENVITKSIRNVDNSIIRQILEKMMKAQYYIYIVFAFVGLLSVWLKDREKIWSQSLLLYVICGFFCFYLIWEIKSRYIYSLYPIFMIYSFAGWDIIIKKINNMRFLIKR